MLLHGAALVHTHPLELAIGPLLRHGPAVEVIRVLLHYVRGRLVLIVQRSHQLVDNSSVANTGVADAAADVRLHHPVHLRIGDQRDQLVDVFQESIPRELRCAHEISRVQLVLVERVLTEHLEHISQQADVAQKVELHIILEVLTLTFRVHLLGVGVIGLCALHDSELVEEALSWR